MNAIYAFIARKRPSVWIGFSIWAIAGTMMHPSFASLIAMMFVGLGLVVLRFTAHVEGQYSPDPLDSIDE